ncbi:MAG: phosphotransferase [Clostridiaceae bacterium]|nr:phosphotransferase [Clostridiaceae bacterium]
MIKVTDKAMNELCGKLSINLKDLEFLGGGRGDSDGIVYTFHMNHRKMVMKILAIPENKADELKSLEIRVRYANFLGENGIRLAYPIKNQNGNLYETSADHQHVYTAYIMEFFAGKNPENDALTDEFVCEWGRIIGKSHRVTKNFADGELDDRFSYKSEMSFFMNWCQDAFVKSAWSEMESCLEALPMGRDDYGFIHNDNHQRNILVLDQTITLIDFDCANRQFFLQDITTPAQGMMFDKTGGLLSPLCDADRLKRFFSCFINGYEKENHLTDFWYNKLTIFINYRRLLLFTCLQDWLNTEASLKDGFLRNIANPPQILL